MAREEIALQNLIAMRLTLDDDDGDSLTATNGNSVQNVASEGSGEVETDVGCGGGGDTEAGAEVGEGDVQLIVAANRAIHLVGMGSYQWRLFVLCGCGWFADNMWLQGVSVVIPSIRVQFGLSEGQMGMGSTFVFLGMMIGGGLWGVLSDVIGRKPAFTLTLLITSVMGFYASFATTFPQFYWRLFLLGTGVGGNLPVDGSLFLEFVPPSHQKLMTLLSLFWPLGQIFTAMIAWRILPEGSCLDAALGCNVDVDNWGWRLVLRVLAGVTLAMVLGRILCVRMLESPKYLLSVGKVQEAEDVLMELAQTNGWNGDMGDLRFRRMERDDVSCASSVHRQVSAGDAEALLGGSGSSSVRRRTSISSSMSSASASVRKFSLQRQLSEWKANTLLGWGLVLDLFEAGTTRRTTVLILAIWSLISLGYTMFNGFLPIFLAKTPDGDSPPISVDETYRNYFILAIMGVPGSIAGTYLIDTAWGRRGTMAASTFGTAGALYLFTLSRTESFQLLCGCVVSVLQNMMYGVLYTYTPEVFASRVRGTAGGVASVCSRVVGCAAPLLTGWLIGVSLSLPLVIASTLIFGAAVCMVLLPVETRGRDVM